MNSDTYFYDPLKGHGLPHDPFKAILAPRLIGWIGTMSAQGQANLAPYSFFGGFSDKPKVIAFSSDGYKDSIRNIEETGEFTWNLTSRALAEAMNRSSAPVPPNVNEFELAGLTQVPGRYVKAPRVGESPASFECKLLQILHLNDLEGKPIPNWIAIGQIVGVHIRHEFIEDGRFNLQAAQPILRAGYKGDYFELGSPFEMIRPKT
jgi:flavin reductase (DIM6/NTAB) family NADH-FMN oxidoreductase RutF